jgi:hypothetical protein
VIRSNVACCVAERVIPAGAVGGGGGGLRMDVSASWVLCSVMWM